MSTNRFYKLFIAAVLVMVLGFTIREAAATASVIDTKPDEVALQELQRLERVRVASAARWYAQAGDFLSSQDPEIRGVQRAMRAESARWNALVAGFLADQEQEMERSQRSIDAEAARWNALAVDTLSSQE